MPPERDETTSAFDANGDRGRNDGLLDRAMRQALWPEPPPRAMARLREAVVFESRRYHRGRATRFYIGAAGSIAAAAAMIVIAVRAWRPLLVPEATPGRTIATGPSVPSTLQAATLPTMVMWREADAYERAAVLTRASTSRRAGQRTPISRNGRRDTTQPTTRASSAEDPLELALASSRPAERARAEATLIARVASKDFKARADAVARLARYGTPRAMPALTKAADDPELAAEAMHGIARLAGPEPVLRRARASTDPAVRRAAYAALLISAGRDGTTAYLSFLLNPARRDEALAALDAAPESQATAALVEQLNNPRIDYRLAAARALAKTCGGGGAGHDAAHHDEVADSRHAKPSNVALILHRLLDQNVCRREVLAALLQCPDDNARRYIASLRTDRSVDSELRALERELADLFG